MSFPRSIHLASWLACVSACSAEHTAQVSLDAALLADAAPHAMPTAQPDSSVDAASPLENPMLRGADVDAGLGITCAVFGVSNGCPAERPVFATACGSLGQVCAYPDSAGSEWMVVFHCTNGALTGGAATPASALHWDTRGARCETACRAASEVSRIIPVDGAPCASRPITPCDRSPGDTEVIGAQKLLLSWFPACNVPEAEPLSVNFDAAGCAVEAHLDLNFVSSSDAAIVSCLAERLRSVRTACAVRCAEAQTSFL